MDVGYAKKIIETLSNGINPMTGELLSGDSVYNEPDVIRALYAAAEALGQCENKMKKTRFKNAGAPWTKADDDKLCAMFESGLTKAELCQYFQRSSGAISSRLTRLGKM